MNKFLRNTLIILIVVISYFFISMFIMSIIRNIFQAHELAQKIAYFWIPCSLLISFLIIRYYNKKKQTLFTISIFCKLIKQLIIKYNINK